MSGLVPAQRLAFLDRFTLRVDIMVLETRLSRSRPGQGVVKVRVTTLNQHAEPVQIFTPTLFVDRRPGEQ